MDVNKLYRRWLEKATDDPDLTDELKSIEGDENAVYERFYRELEFGTGGLRGELGAGTNRMNIYNVRKATQGLANWLLKSGGKKSVAIAHDSRIKSGLFAKEAARVLAANGITAHLYPRLEPTPALSFAVRHLGCGAGICVTASHNPAIYNGYKAYGSDGCQVTTEAAAAILGEIQAVDPFDDVQLADYDGAVAEGRIKLISEETLDAFIAAVKGESTNPPADAPLKLVYTPLNGAGLECVTRILTEIGITDVTIVPEQKDPDGHFPTCPYPNPEIREALQKGLDLCETVQPDLLLATDPDCDRVGIAVRQKGVYQLLSGNQVGVLLLDYICKTRVAAGTMPERPVTVKTIVTTDMIKPVAAKYGVELREVLTGFKYIGEQIGLLEKDGEANRYIFGFEESYGYLSGSYVRDKDAVNGAMLICEMAQSYKHAGLTLVDALEELYEEYGHYANTLMSFEFKGAAGMQEMDAIMQRLRKEPPANIGDFEVVGRVDYATGEGVDRGKAFRVDLPGSDVLEFNFATGERLIIRPSGTEPKIKIYLSAKADTIDAAEAICTKLGGHAQDLLKS